MRKGKDWYLREHKMITIKDDLLLKTKDKHVRPAYADGLEVLCDNGYKKCSVKMVKLTEYTKLNMSNGMVLQLSGREQVLTPKGYKPLDELRVNSKVTHDWLGWDIPKGEFNRLVDVDEFSYEGSFTLDIGRIKFATLAGIFASSGVRKTNGNWTLKVNDNVQNLDGQTPEEFLAGLGLVVVGKTRNTFEVKNTPELEVLKGYFGGVEKKGSKHAGEHYIPDEILTGASDEWLSAFAKGVDRTYSKMFHKILRIPLHNFMSNSEMFVNDYAHLRYFGNLGTFMMFNISNDKDSYKPGMYRSPVNEKFDVCINYGDTVIEANDIGFCIDVGDGSGIYLSGFYIK